MMRDFHRNIMTGLMLLVTTAAIGLASYSVYAESRHNASQSNALCRNQHAVVEMQRLFLKEHAALREQLRRVGIHEHPNPGLLQRLGELIEAGDCDVSEFKEEGM